MLSSEQLDRVEREVAEAASKAHAAARFAESDHESYLYPRGPQKFDPAVRAAKLSAFNEADYQAESRAYILNLIRADRSKLKPGIPHNAVCFYQDGSQWCAVFGDFVDLQSSPAGFGDNFEEAMSDLRSQKSA